MYTVIMPAFCMVGVSDTFVFIFPVIDFICSFVEIILSFIVLMIALSDFIFSDIDSRFLFEKFFTNFYILPA